MKTKQVLTASQAAWDEFLPVLSQFVEIPNKSPKFDENWQRHGHMERAVILLKTWAQEQDIAGLMVEVVRIDGHTPILFMEVPATQEGIGTILMYGHYDKQPEMEPWREGLAPWKAVLEGDRLYGRGGADDGYATFASLAAIRIVQQQGESHGRIVVIIEGSEESGSVDLPAYIDLLSDRIGTPDLVICLDASCGDYDHLWTTTSLRGMMSGDLTVRVLTEGVHSGLGSGVAPDPTMLAFWHIQELFGSKWPTRSVPELDTNGLWANIPADRQVQAQLVADELGDEVYSDLPWHGTAGPDPLRENEDLVLQRTWAPTLTIIGVEGFPANLKDAGNVLLPYITLRLSFRLPPTVDAEQAARVVKAKLERSNPFGAEITFNVTAKADGWNAPPIAPWLEKSLQDASVAFFEKPSMLQGSGGSIPFIGMLGKRFPDAQFFITGLLGPMSNAHGPNEFLDIPTGVKLTACVANVISDHAKK